RERKGPGRYPGGGSRGPDDPYGRHYRRSAALRTRGCVARRYDRYASGLGHRGLIGRHHDVRRMKYMSKKKAKSAELIMKLYELRREPTMRDARNWFATFFPESTDDVMTAMLHPDSSAFFRM